MWPFSKKSVQTNEDGAVFVIDGVPRKERGKINKSRVAAYGDRIFIELDGESDEILCRDIYHVFIQDPIIEEVPCRTTVIKFYEEGEETYYELEDDTFAGLSDKMEALLSDEWRQFSEMKQDPETVAWFKACSAPYHISFREDPDLFGGEVPTPEIAGEMRKTLFTSWSINNVRDLRGMLESLFEGRAQHQFEEALSVLATDPDQFDEEETQSLLRIKQTCGTKGIWAWDLCRLMLLCELGWLCGHIGREEALDKCLEAGRKMQSIYSGWDDMAASYALGYGFWAEEDPEDGESEAWNRANIYAELKKRRNGPYALRWNLPLRREW